MQDPLITKRISELTPTYREFLFSGVPQMIAGTFSETYNFTEEQDAVLENGFVLYLLFFFTRSELASFITSELKLSVKDAGLLSQAMHLALPEDIRALHETTSEALLGNNNPDEPETILSEIAETEAALGAISRPAVHAIRTMAGDSKGVGYQSTKESTYSSDQSNLLQK